jgi:hypothetical protein
MIYSKNFPLYCKHIIRLILAPILRDLLDWGEGVAGISKLCLMLGRPTTINEQKYANI